MAATAPKTCRANSSSTVLVVAIIDFFQLTRTLSRRCRWVHLWRLWTQSEWKKFILPFFSKNSDGRLIFIVVSSLWDELEKNSWSEETAESVGELPSASNYEPLRMAEIGWVNTNILLTIFSRSTREEFFSFCSCRDFCLAIDMRLGVPPLLLPLNKRLQECFSQIINQLQSWLLSS